MTTEFPYPSNRHLVDRVDRPPSGVTARRWVLRDDNEQHYHGVLPLGEQPAFIELSWKPDARGREQRVGLFRLDLHELLQGGYIRSETTDQAAPSVRVRFVRGDRGVVFIQVGREGPAVAVGTVDRSA